MNKHNSNGQNGQVANNAFPANHWPNSINNNINNNNNNGNNKNIWGSSTYSDVVALSPVETKVNNIFSPSSGVVNMMNGTGNRNRMADHGLSRGSSFNVKSDIFEQEICGSSVASDLGPIGTKKSPSSTPIWEQFAPITKPSSMYSNTNYFSPTPNYNGNYVNHQQSPPPPQPIQQSKLMNHFKRPENQNSQANAMNILFSNSNLQNPFNNQQQTQSPNAQQEAMLLYMYKKDAESKMNNMNYDWNSTGNTPTSSNSYWSPAYRQQQPGISVTPGLRPPPGLVHSAAQQQQLQQYQQMQLQQQLLLQQQQQQQQHAQNNQNNQTAAVMPAYDPFKSLKAIWAPNSGQNDTDSWNN